MRNHTVVIFTTHRVYPITNKSVPLGNYTFVVFDGEDILTKGEQKLKEVYNWSKGFHYDDLTYKVKNSVESNKKEMTTKNQQIEDAVVIEETANEVVDKEVQTAEVLEESNPNELIVNTVNEKKGEYSTSLALPKFEAPTVFKLDGQVYSIQGAEDIGKEIDKKIAQLTEDKFENDKLKSELKELKQKAVKYRTTSKKILDSAFKPLNEAIKSTVSNCKSIGDKAMEAQERAEAHLKLIENWEEEQERIRLEAISKKADERVARLLELEGNYNPATLVVSFPYSPGTIFNREQISNMEDDEFENDLAYVAKLHKEDKERRAAEASEAEQKNAALLDKQRKLRKKELMLEDFDFDTNLNAFCHESGVKVFSHEIDTLSAEDWDARIAKINGPSDDPAAKSTTPAPAPSIEIDDENPFGDPKVESKPAPAIDPLASVISGMVEQHEEHQDKVDGIVKIVLEFSKDNPFFDVMIGRSIMRVSPLELEEQSMHNIDTDSVLGTNVHGELKFTAYKGGSHK